jgi:hypothetical protein
MSAIQTATAPAAAANEAARSQEAASAVAATSTQTAAYSPSGTSGYASQQATTAAYDPADQSCISVKPPHEPGFGGWINSCGYDIELTFCVVDPDPDSWSSAFSCAEGKMGAVRVPANGRAGSHNRGGRQAAWFACKSPGLPQARYEPGQGLVGGCR